MRLNSNEITNGIKKTKALLGVKPVRQPEKEQKNYADYLVELYKKGEISRSDMQDSLRRSRNPNGFYLRGRVVR